MTSDRPVALVANREVTEGVRSKGFWIMLGDQRRRRRRAS